MIETGRRNGHALALGNARATLHPGDHRPLCEQRLHRTNRQGTAAVVLLAGTCSPVPVRPQPWRDGEAGVTT
jgi:hypothetical protein